MTAIAAIILLFIGTLLLFLIAMLIACSPCEMRQDTPEFRRPLLKISLRIVQNLERLSGMRAASFKRRYVDGEGSSREIGGLARHYGGSDFQGCTPSHTQAMISNDCRDP